MVTDRGTQSAPVAPVENKEPIENILWAWTPSKSQKEFCERNKTSPDLAEEYRIVKIADKYPAGIMVWGKYHGNEWIANPNGRYVIRELLRLFRLSQPDNKGAASPDTASDKPELGFI
jgi:hypothetical protein